MLKCKKGVLLINLGTPDKSDGTSVRRYLREFLLDPRVIDLPSIVRGILVNVLIVPFRYKKTASAYQKIWMKEGSPLLVISKKMQQKLAAVLGADYQVELGMRYGKPSIESALLQLRECDSISVIPLFPQYSSAATGSAIEKCLEKIAPQWNMPQIKIINDFYQHPGFVQAVAEIMQSHLQNKNIDKIIFSYHGLPERHITKSACMAQCDHVHACPQIDIKNRFCYRAQCYATTECLMDAAQLSKEKCVTSFQSRLGRTPWIKPYTDLLLPELIQQGVKNIAIVSPSFIADCLETLEEINLRLREQWQQLGGSEFVFIPCVNESDLWIQALARMV